jgi:hypothetical protein
VQLNLHFPQTPLPNEELWEQLSNAQQDALIETLAQPIAKAGATPQEAPNE